MVADVLSVLGEEAAAENDKLQLFTSPERFPEVLHPLRHVTAGGKLTADSKLGMKPDLERSPRRDGREDEHHLVCWCQVFEQAEAVAAAEKALERLLPDLRRQLRLPSLQYVHPANQGVSQAGRSQQHVLSQVSLGIARASVPDTLLWTVCGIPNLASVSRLACTRSLQDGFLVEVPSGRKDVPKVCPSA